MVPELGPARVTELQVRMDCNGCVQRIKKAMHDIDGVHGVSIDLAQQKLTVVGSADPERMVRAIKKTRRIATICSHTEPTEPPPTPTEPPTDQPPTEAPAPPAEPPAPPPENPAPEVKPSPEASEAAPAEPKDVEQIHMVHHYPRSYGYREHWNHDYPHTGHEMRHEEAPYYVTHSYNSYRPSHSTTDYGYFRSPPPPRDGYYREEGAYSDDYYRPQGGRNGNQITSMFSDENPNACRIV